MLRRAILLTLWLSLVAVLGVMGFFMLEACGLRIPGGPLLIKLCGEREEPPPALVAQVLGRGQELEREIVRLENRLAQSASCPVPLAPIPEPEEHAKVEPEPGPKPEKKPKKPAACPRPRPVEVAMLLDASASMDTRLQPRSGEGRAPRAADQAAQSPVAGAARRRPQHH